GMNPVDIGNALIYGVPLVSCIGYGYEYLIGCRGRPLVQEGAPSTSSPSQPNLPLMQRNELRLAVAQSREQRAAARDLVNQRYAWRGYQCAAPTDRKTLADRAAHEITFIVEDRKTTVGTVTLGFDGPL